MGDQSHTLPTELFWPYTTFITMIYDKHTLRPIREPNIKRLWYYGVRVHTIHDRNTLYTTSIRFTSADLTRFAIKTYLGLTYKCLQVQINITIWTLLYSYCVNNHVYFSFALHQLNTQNKSVHQIPAGVLPLSPPHLRRYGLYIIWPGATSTVDPPFFINIQS